MTTVCPNSTVAVSDTVTGAAFCVALGVTLGVAVGETVAPSAAPLVGAATRLAAAHATTAPVSRVILRTRGPPVVSTPGARATSRESSIGRTHRRQEPISTMS